MSASLKSKVKNQKSKLQVKSKKVLFLIFTILIKHLSLYKSTPLETFNFLLENKK